MNRVPQSTIEELTLEGFSDAWRLDAMLGSVIPAEVRSVMWRKLRKGNSRIKTDTITTALLSHRGINPAVLAYAATIVSPITVSNDDGYAVAMMAGQGITMVDMECDASPGAAWYSHEAFVRSNDPVPRVEGKASAGLFKVPRLPESVVTLMPGRPLRDIFTHPALDAFDLVVLDAANGARTTYIRTTGQEETSSFDLADMLNPAG